MRTALQRFISSLLNSWFKNSNIMYFLPFNRIFLLL